MTQNAKLLVYLESHDGITTLEAMAALKICRLSERIRELTDLGYRFRHDQETTPHGAHVTRYRLTKAAAQDGATTTACGRPQMVADRIPPPPASAAPLPPDAPYAVGQLRRERGKLVEVTGVGIGHDGLRFVAVRDVA